MPNTCKIRYRHRKQPVQQNGFSLLEVLIALVLLSIGLLGLAGLQMSSLKNTSSADNRFEATAMAYDILDRMRANRNQSLSGDYDVDLTETTAGTAVAKTDVEAWKTALAQLPAGDGTIATDADTRIVTVTVQWGESWDADLLGGVGRVVLRTQL